MVSMKFYPISDSKLGVGYENRSPTVRTLAIIKVLKTIFWYEMIIIRVFYLKFAKNIQEKCVGGSSRDTYAGKPSKSSATRNQFAKSD